MHDRTNGETCTKCSEKRRGLWKYGKLWRFCDCCDMGPNGWGAPTHMSLIGRGFDVARSTPIVPPDAPLAQDEEDET